MKPGDRIRVLRGEHEGRTGSILPPNAQVEALRRLLKPSPARDELERRARVPVGSHGVMLGSDAIPGSVQYAVIREEDLVVPATELQWIPTVWVNQ